MKELDFLIEILPIIVASLLGSVSKDVMDFARGKDERRRLFRVGVSFITSVFVVGFGVTSWIPNLDWKILALAGYASGFVGFKIATLLGDSLVALSLIPGVDKIRDSIERAETLNKLRELEERNKALSKQDPPESKIE